ncbi:Circularly permuted type 2 ATP-grasp protein [Planctomycetales bacterium 10988]|nr:Circularly permuted type 2 ATP-grasp protein [Planctomycetales bacterium 10988]
MKFDTYQCEKVFDEMFQNGGLPRTKTKPVVDRLERLVEGELERCQSNAQVTLRNMGITFNVYGQDAGIERIWPLDVVPRILPLSEWQDIEAGLKQRVRAINAFIHDMYGDRKIIQDDVVPEWLMASSPAFRKPLKGFTPPQGVWTHISGVDLVRDQKGEIYVLEDNMRVPSGVSYVLENREVMKRSFPQVFQGLTVLPVEDYPERLLETLQDIAPEHVAHPNVVVLTPGIYNSAYFEHSFLAQQMGVELVQGSDLITQNKHVYMRSTRGLQRVDVIYRRVDDDFLDPHHFRSDSVLGVPGLIDAYLAGNVSLANAPGTGIADDKAVYAFVPDMIKYYLSEDAILSNVPTHLAGTDEGKKYILENMEDLVIKPTSESGGYGIMFGPRATKEQIEEYRKKIEANPRNYVAQPMLSLSTVPTLCGGALEARHVDLRPFVLFGKDIYVLPGGLTRVAMEKGSMVVNSSQGGGSKDTWVLAS